MVSRLVRRRRKRIGCICTGSMRIFIVGDKIVSDGDMADLGVNR